MENPITPPTIRSARRTPDHFLKTRHPPLLACLGLMGALSCFSLCGVALTGDMSGMTDPEMLGVLWQTPVDNALI